MLKYAICTNNVEYVINMHNKICYFKLDIYLETHFNHFV